MNVIHHTRKTEYRTPFGAVEPGTEVTLSADVWDGASCVCRLWRDGFGETLVPMTAEERGGFARFSCVLTPEGPGIVWYFFIVTSADGGTRYYGAADGRTGGEGVLRDGQPPSFQLTVYKKRPLPDWYKNAVVYQIFPDSFARGADFEKRAKTLDAARKGPARRIKNWDEPPRYEKDAAGRVTRWDFYGGTLLGIKEKLPYLKAMGVTALYLNPVFEAASPHRYDTADYMKIDPLLGDEAGFRDLCRSAAGAGIRIILDGVFNHTGCDSRYFDRYGNYGGGAFSDENSPYKNWYRFTDGGYDCWWGVDDLPAVNEDEPSYRGFIAGKDGVVARWLAAGASGFRLDVADELPDGFIGDIKKAVTETKNDGLLLGEVWEDASSKISYGKLRRYLLGDGLDSVMNYPLRAALLDFLTDKIPAPALEETILSLMENYPPEAFAGCLNMLGSHDRPRLMTVLGGGPEEGSLSEEERAAFRLEPWRRSLAKSRLWLAALLQMTLPGVPCVYYGDEAGMEGYSDPFNRGPYPWGQEDADAGIIYRNAIFFKKTFPVFTDGETHPFSCGDDVFGVLRENGEESMAVLVNRSQSETREARFTAPRDTAEELVSGGNVEIKEGEARIVLPPMGSAVVRFGGKTGFAHPLRRGAGVLCHITSVPNGGKPGTFGKCARDFADTLARTGQKYWQVLPLSPADEYGSPYSGDSAFAGNLDLLEESGEDLERMFADFVPEGEYEKFVSENGYWLRPYAEFASLRGKYPSETWQSWPFFDENDPFLKKNYLHAVFCQFIFHKRWVELKKYVNGLGIKIIGDLPMFLSENSADVWSRRELFKLDANGRPAECAGVPPDAFAENGQNWGNPLYNWAAMEKDGWEWWLRRLGRAFELYDFVRLDHFRGFEACWSIPAGADAKAGRWTPACGTALFEAAYRRFGPLPIIAEDLGTITPAVRGLLAACGFPGIDVLQFAHGDVRDHVPPKNKIVYSGTHDNRPLVPWCAEHYPDENAEKLAKTLENRIFMSDADVAILPLQDVLLLGDSSRMNTPGTKNGNWRWRAREEDVIAAEPWLRQLTFDSERG